MERIVGVKESSRGYWYTDISVNGVSYFLISSYSRPLCVRVRRKAEIARANGTFPEFYKRLLLEKSKLKYKHSA